LDGEGLGGIAADERRVIVSCRDSLDQRDVFVCLSAENGQTIWRFDYEAPGRLDYGNTPRATPLILDESVVVLGAFGDLHCLDLETGVVLWKTQLLSDWGGELPTWGFCGTPLLIDDTLILQTCDEEAALIALDVETGDLVWKSPGRPASYSSLVLAQVGGMSQIIGFDQESLGGWSPNGGDRLWEIIPDEPNDFNVPTPIVDESGVFVATENNGARRYEFNRHAIPGSVPTATFREFSPDTHTAVQVGNRIFGVRGKLFCLDATTLQPIWIGEDEAFDGHASIVATSEVVLVFTAGGELLLVDVNSDHFEIQSRTSLTNKEVDLYSHPAFAGKRMFVRLGASLACVDWEQPASPE
jgi:outer membrane protein assembly factor BamB